MKRGEAERLLGGYATGTLTEEERRILFTAALRRQDLFDALMHEEALRELLQDPTVKAQLIAATAPAEAPRAVPFWRQPRVLGSAASLLMASLAGLVYLRSPQRSGAKIVKSVGLYIEDHQVSSPPSPTPKPLSPRPEATAPQVETIAGGGPPPSPLSAAPPPPAHASLETSPQAWAKESPAPLMEQASPAKKAEAPPRRVGAQDRQANGVATGVPGGVSGGVVGGVASPRAPAPVVDVAAEQALEKTAAPPQPQWKLETSPDGKTQVTVWAHPNNQPLLLKRGRAAVEVLRLHRPEDARGDLIPWRTLFQLAPGDVLDLYLLNHPVDNPAQLPEAGAVDGIRIRLHPTGK